MLLRVQNLGPLRALLSKPKSLQRLAARGDSMNNYTIAVWEITFYKVGEDGEALTDSKGNVQLYDATDYDCSYLAEGLDDDDLEER